MIHRTPNAASGYLIKEAALLIIALCYLLIVAGTSSGVTNYDFVRFGVAVLTAVGIGWWLYGAGRGVAPVPLSVPLLVFLAAYLLTALTSIDPRRSLGEVWLAGVAMLIFAVTVDLVARGWPRELFVKALLLTGGVVLGLGWYFAVSWYQRWLAAAPGEWLPAITYRLPGPNTTAWFLNLLLMPALARLFATRARLPRLLLAGWAAAAIGLIYLTSSRGGWLGAAAGIGAALGLSLRGQGAQLRRVWASLRRRRALLPLLAIGLAGGMLIGWAAYRQMAHPTHGHLLLSRAEFWGPAWVTFLGSPWFGQGPFTFGSAYLRANSVPPDLIYVHAHSVLFNLLAETGIVGLASFGLLVLEAFRALRQKLRQASGDERLLVIGAISALVAYAVHGLFDTVSTEPASPFVVAILLGAALAPAGEHVQSRPRLGYRWPVALWLVLAATGEYGVWLLTPLRAGIVASNRQDWQETVSHLSEAVRRDPWSAVTHQQLGLANSVLAAQGTPGALEQAIAAFERTVALDPDWSLNHANLGALYAAHGDVNAARAELRAATELASGEALYYLNLGLVAESAGDDSEAGPAYASALTLRPEWADAYLWRTTPFRAAALARWRQAAPATLSPTLADLEASIADNPPVALPYARLADTYLGLGRLQPAAALLQKADVAYIGRPEERLEVLWVRAKLAAAQSDWAAATSLGEQAVDGYRAPSIFGPGWFGAPGYVQLMFRREAMATEIVPQMTLVRVTDRWAERMLRLGEWYEVGGNPRRAVEIYQEVLTYVPDNAKARARLLENVSETH